MLQRLFGLAFGLFLFFPVAPVLRWLLVDELGIYQEMTLTDSLLAIIIVLVSVLIFGQPRRPLTAGEISEQAKEMELASRRLKRAQEEHAELLRARRHSRRAASRDSSASRHSPQQPPRSSSARSTRPARSSRTSRSDRASRSDRTSRDDRRRYR